MTEIDKKEMLAQALREYPTWGDAYIAKVAELERVKKSNESLKSHRATIQGVVDRAERAEKRVAWFESRHVYTDEENQHILEALTKQDGRSITRAVQLLQGQNAPPVECDGSLDCEAWEHVHGCFSSPEERDIS